MKKITKVAPDPRNGGRILGEKQGVSLESLETNNMKEEIKLLSFLVVMLTIFVIILAIL